MMLSQTETDIIEPSHASILILLKYLCFNYRFKAQYLKTFPVLWEKHYSQNA